MREEDLIYLCPYSDKGLNPKNLKKLNADYIIFCMEVCTTNYNNKKLFSKTKFIVPLLNIKF